jgi:hypothetical protein
MTLTPTLPIKSFSGRFSFGTFILEFIPKGAPATTAAKVL